MNILKIAQYSAIIQVILVIPAIVVALAAELNPSSLSYQYSRAASGFVFLFFSLIIYLGYLSLAEKYRLQRLKRVLYAMLILFPLFVILLISLAVSQSFIIVALSIVLTIAEGIISLLFGRVLKRVGQFKPYARSLGNLYIIAGILQLSIILTIFSSLMMIPMRIIEAKLFKKVRSVQK